MRRGKVPPARKGFTGLEAAIVLTAFVVVAAVFSYVVLNAGFFTTQKSKEVVHTGVDQATSSVELAGDVIAFNGSGDLSDRIVNVTFYLRLTAGQNPIDLNNTVISYTNERVYVPNLIYNPTPTQGTWRYNVSDSGGDNLIDGDEIVQIEVMLPYANHTEAYDGLPKANEYFTVEVKPPQGATLSITRKAPAAIEEVMNLH